MKFLINKVSKKYICLVTRDNYIFNIELYEIIETDLFINNNFLVNKWNGSEWIEGATPEEIAEQELEKQKILKQQQYEELLETDWYVVRFVETGVKIPEEILQQRQDIRNKYK